MTRQKKRRKPQAPARFHVGDRVRVRRGILDCDHPDMPLGGWAGTIASVSPRRLYLVRWSPQTLEAIHPICERRCAIERTELGSFWLGDSDLDPDLGGPLDIEQPKRIVPRPLSEGNQEDRVRMVLGLTTDDFLPLADEDSLETYFDYLAERLSLPMDAKYWPSPDMPATLAQPMKIVALDDEIGWDEDDGIYCKYRLGGTEGVVPMSHLKVRPSNPNFRIVDDFSQWFTGNLDPAFDEDCLDDQETDGGVPDEYDEFAAPDDSSDWQAERPSTDIWRLAIIFSAIGAVVGTTLATMHGARWGVCIGVGSNALLLCMDEWSMVRKLRERAIRFRKILATAITGPFHGALFGALAVAFIGSLLGIASLLAARLHPGIKRRMAGRMFACAMLAAGCGAAAEAFYLSPHAAARGLGYGALIGLSGGSVLFLASFAIQRLLFGLMPKPRYWRVR